MNDKEKQNQEVTTSEASDVDALVRRKSEQFVKKYTLMFTDDKEWWGDILTQYFYEENYIVKIILEMGIESLSPECMNALESVINQLCKTRSKLNYTEKFVDTVVGEKNMVKECEHEWEKVSAVKCECCGMIIED